jgi:hypothetical protein
MATVPDGATLEFATEDIPMADRTVSTQHFCVVRVGYIKARVDFRSRPVIQGNGWTIENEYARVTKLLHRAYACDNAANVAIQGWGTGYDPDEDPDTDWLREIHSSICARYTALLQEESLETLVVQLLLDGNQLRSDFLKRYFETLIRGRYQLSPSEERFAELLQAFKCYVEPGTHTENPFYTYVHKELPSQMDAEQFQHAGRILIADRKQGHFDPMHGRL